MSITSERIPILIVAGFLGSGKTTFIREVIPHIAKGSRVPFVILNDFLNATIDAFTLKDLGAEIKTLAAGCVCCEDPSSLINTLLNIPDSIRPLIILEANGATDPYSLIETITLTPSLRSNIGPIIQVTIINEARWGKRWLPGDKHTERAQLKTASAIITNRGDRAAEKQRSRVSDDIQELNPRAPRLHIDQFVELLLSETTSNVLPAPNMQESPGHHHHHHVAVQLAPPRMTEDQLRKWLISLPPEILRIKGLAWISDERMAYFSRTDDALETPRIIPTTPQDGMNPAAVFIGPGVTEESVRKTFTMPIASTPPPFKLTF